MTHSFFRNPFSVGTILTLGIALFTGSTPAAPAETFSTPQAAVAALGHAIQTTNRVALSSLFGDGSEDLINPDEVQSAADLAEFTAAFNETNRLVRDSEHRMTLEVGHQKWPFPIPLTATGGRWRFDTEAGREELLNRRIGRNELAVLGTVRAYVQAQRDYASRDRDGDQVLEYAQRIASSPGKMDGLYWSPEATGEVSPLGPLVAEAQSTGYFSRSLGRKTGPRPFHGYEFKILARQGRHAPGGKYDYIINGNMIGGFALVAWPAEYGNSGIMTFIVNQQGKVYQKDLGKDTDRRARGMTTYDLDPSWQESRD